MKQNFIAFLLACLSLSGAFAQSVTNPSSGGGGGGSQTYDLLTPGDKAAQGGTPGYAAAKNATIASGSSLTLLSFTGNGYLSSMWLAFANETSSGKYIELKIVADGVTVYDDAEGNFFGAGYWGFGTGTEPTWASNLVAYMGGQFSQIPVPFGTSLVVTVKNNEPSNALSIWYDLQYVSGVAPTVWTRTGHLNVNVQSDNDSGLVLTQDQIGTLMNATGLTAGRLLGIALIFEGAPGSASNNTFLEGPLSIYCDGTLILKTSGAEDYFGMSGYFAGIPAGFANDWAALTMKRASPPLYGALRMHVNDPILFNNSLKVTWQAGLASTGNTFTGSVTLYWTIWYYTT